MGTSRQKLHVSFVCLQPLMFMSVFDTLAGKVKFFTFRVHLCSFAAGGNEVEMIELKL
jgi:hypothetical protein